MIRRGMERLAAAIEAARRGSRSQGIRAIIARES